MSTDSRLRAFMAAHHEARWPSVCPEDPGFRNSR